MRMDEDHLATHDISVIRSGDQGQVGADLRSRIQHPVTQELYDHWQRLRGAREMADRAQIEPADLKRVLPHLLLLDVEGKPPRFRYRLVGTAIRETREGLAVTDQTGHYADEITHNYTDNNPLIDFKTCYAERRPVLARGGFDDNAQVFGYYERIVLPLTHGGDDLTMLLVGFVKASLPLRPPAVD